MLEDPFASCGDSRAESSLEYKAPSHLWKRGQLEARISALQTALAEGIHGAEGREFILREMHRVHGCLNTFQPLGDFTPPEFGKHLPFIAVPERCFDADTSFSAYLFIRGYDFHLFSFSGQPYVVDCEVIVGCGSHCDTDKYCSKTRHETMKSIHGLKYTTNLSCSGLVYATIGKHVISKIIQEIDANCGEMKDLVDYLFKRTYELFVQGIDQDSQKPSSMWGLAGIHGRIQMLRRKWNEIEVSHRSRCEYAVALVGGEFEIAVKYLHSVYWPARELLKTAMLNRCDSRVVVVREPSVPWNDIFYEIEEDLELTESRISVIVYKRRPNDDWIIEAIPVSHLHSETRIAIPHKWFSYTRSQLKNIASIRDSVFLRCDGRLAECTVLDDAVHFAQKVVRASEKKSRKRKRKQRKTDGSSRSGTNTPELD